MINSNTTSAIIYQSMQQLTGLASGTIRKSKSRDVLGNWTIGETTLDRGNRLVTDITDPVEANTNAETVTRNGLMQTARDTSGHTATFAYDDLGRPTTAQDPRHTGGSVSETHYDSGGRVDWTEDPANNRTTYAFDGTTGRLSTVTDANSKVTRYSYKDRGQTTRVWGDVPQPTETGYDSTYGDRTTLSTYRGGSGGSGSSWPGGTTGTADTTTWTLEAFAPKSSWPSLGFRGQGPDVGADMVERAPCGRDVPRFTTQ